MSFHSRLSRRLSAEKKVHRVKHVKRMADVVVDRVVVQLSDIGDEIRHKLDLVLVLVLVKEIAIFPRAMGAACGPQMK